MALNQNKFIAVSYKLYAIEDGQTDLFEEAPADNPYQFISGMGTTLDDFENQIKDLEKGADFNFIIPCEKAYGTYDKTQLLELSKNIFMVNGKFDTVHIQKGAIVPLLTGTGQRVNAIVADIKQDTVVVDFNHPLAGADLRFKGKVIENRPATNKEIEEMTQILSKESCGGCGGGCQSGGCDGNCDGCD